MYMYKYMCLFVYTYTYTCTLISLYTSIYMLVYTCLYLLVKCFGSQLKSRYIYFSGNAHSHNDSVQWEACNFSRFSSTVILYSKQSSELTFENLYLVWRCAKKVSWNWFTYIFIDTNTWSHGIDCKWHMKNLQINPAGKKITICAQIRRRHAQEAFW